MSSVDRLGPPLRACALRFVLVRGLAREAGHWRQFEVELRARFPDATIECHDLAGNGDQHARVSPLRIGSLAEDLRRRVWAANARPPIVVAISLGAMVGLTWLTRWPAEIQGLVTINTSAGGLSPPFRRLRPTGLMRTLAAVTERDDVVREQRVLALTTRHLVDDQALAHAHARLHAERPVRRANVVRQIVAAAGFRVRPGAVPVEHAPVLMLASKLDGMVDPSCTGALAEVFGARQAEHPDAGHDLTLDDPAWCVERISAWLG